MRRSICFCEPNQALAGEFNTWSFFYTTAIDLPKGTLLRFDLVSEEREIDWELPSVNLKKKCNVIYGKLENGKIIQAKEIQIADSFTPLYEFVLPSELKAGTTFSIIVGSPQLTEKLKEKNGTQAQTYSQRRRPFLLYIDTSGKGQFEDPEVFSMDIKGNVLHHINLITPSFVGRNKKFDITIRFEDEYGNLTSNAPVETLIELSYKQLRENLKWKLFVPETGYIVLPNQYFNEVGTYTIILTNCHTQEKFKSPPMRCFQESETLLFWGLLHGESTKVDSGENIENCLRHFRDEKSYNFFASSSFESIDETPNDIWRLLTQNVSEFDEDERFTTFLGFQWKGNPKTEGVRQFIFSKDNKQIMRKKEAKNSSLKKIYKTHSPRDFISIPSFTMGKNTEFTFKDFNPDFERVVEIYNSWGSSECSKKDGNHFPIKGPAKKGIQEAHEGAIITALMENKRFGFVAGGLDDRGLYQDFFDNEQEQYNPGLTAIIAKEHTRQSLYEALLTKSCYATTGARIIINMNIAGIPIGQESNTWDKHGFHINRHISGFAAGTCKLKLIEIIRNGKILITYKPKEYHFDFTYDDFTPLKDVVIDAKDKNPPFVFYYLRVTQEDGHMAWVSPIWIDYMPGKPIKNSKLPLKSQDKALLKDPDDLDDVDDE